MIKIFRTNSVAVITGIVFCFACTSQSNHREVLSTYHEEHRPQIHFSPMKKWTNDPNGMVYHNGVWHLFFQYYPDSTVWGPMHWGYTTSTDLVHWKEQPIALYPDSLGYIFSGSAVVDENNTSGFGKDGQAPLVAIFTHHDPKGEKEKRNDFQVQSLAYSTDNGKTWIKYSGNPVLKNPGITDFRDPKVMWYEPQKKWVMTLATKDHITFFSSPDLKNWKEESKFGKDIGAHGGVWECPDLFPMKDGNKDVWILIVNLNPGGPNKGSATQYFVGDFNGKDFTPYTSETKWLDYGPDEYAGITWSNTGDRKVFLGWMSNWLYANVVPTIEWRNAMTVPRDLQLKKIGNDYRVASVPVPELSKIQSTPEVLENLSVDKTVDLNKKLESFALPARINLQFDKMDDFSLVLNNEEGEEIVIGYHKASNEYFIDRTKSGKTDFQKDFAAKHVVPRFTNNPAMDLTLIIDVSSVELFADEGLSVMTDIFFPTKPYDKIQLRSNGNLVVKRFEYSKMKGIWD